jgi:hypothetical protein
MRALIVEVGIALGLLGGLSYAISATNDEAWLTAWFLLFIFLAIPLGLLATRDAIAKFSKTKSESGYSWLLLHTCAAFALFIGWGLGRLAEWSQHPMASRHQWLVLALPAIVYAFGAFQLSGSLRRRPEREKEL